MGWYGGVGGRDAGIEGWVEGEWAEEEINTSLAKRRRAVWRARMCGCT